MSELEHVLAGFVGAVVLRAAARRVEAPCFLAAQSLTIAALICLLADSSSAQQLRNGAQQVAPSKKVWTVYLSRTNNTKAIAEMIHREVGGTLVALELETPYPTN